LTWALLGIHQKPIMLINIAGYWDSFLATLDAAVAAAFLRPTYRDVMLVMPDVNLACDAVARIWLR
jgi:predicted Rossmann-fold nucleotide-binding protein